MKKGVIVLAVLLFAIKVNAQIGILNHVTLGVNVGTTGIGADIAMPVTRFFEVQAGVSVMPRFKYNTEAHLNMPLNTINQFLPQQIDINDIPVQGKPKMLNGSILINFLPIPISSFHITAGAYFGGTDVLEIYNKNDGQLAPITQVNDFIRKNNLPIDEVGVGIGNYLLTPDANGNIRATVKTKSFKPYVGIGFGRAVLKKKPIGFKIDLGAIFWGTPDVIDHNGVNLMKQDWGGNDGGAFKLVSKMKVYPVLNLRVSGKIF